MKKIFLLASLLASGLGLADNSLSAQTHYSSNIALGVKGGVDLSRVNFSPSVKQSFVLGGNAGVTFRYIEENHFGLIGEVNFEQRGWKEDFEEYPFEYSRTINYIQIPLLAHIYFGRRGKFFINLGPEVGFNIGESTKANFDYTNISGVEGFPEKLRITYQYGLAADKKVDFGISAGLGGEFNLTRRNSMYVEGRFYYGLGNVVKSGRADSFRGSNSMSIMINVGYWFRIK